MSSKVKARSLEALLGAAAGTAGGAVVGRLAYSPKDPLEWTDDAGNVQGRSLTTEERQARRQLIAQAALIGAGVGSAGSLGGSLVRRARLSKMERDAAKDLGDTYLLPLQDLLSQYKNLYHQTGRVPAGQEGSIGKKLQKRIHVASSLLRGEEKNVTDLLDTAAERRAAKPFGGRTWSSRRGERIPIYGGSHADLVRKHFAQLARANGFDNLTQSNHYAVYENAIERGLRKQAFALELQAIGRSA